MLSPSFCSSWQGKAGQLAYMRYGDASGLDPQATEPWERDAGITTLK